MITLRDSATRLRENSFEILLAGYVILFFAFILAPIVIVVVISFSSAGYVTFPIPGLSLRWFQRVYEYKPFIEAIVVTLQIAFLSAFLAVVLSVPAALVLARSRRRSSELLMTFLLSPLSMPLIVLGFAQLFFLSAIGFGVSFKSLLVAHTVVSIPYIVRTVAAVYRGLPTNFEESALVLGATRLQTFLYVTLPLIRPGIFAGSLFAVLLSIDNLPISYFFGSPGTSTLPVVMLSYLENQFDPSIAALSTIQMVFAIIALVVVDRLYGLRAMSPPS
jgi:putative spermidine/putrescine transport system permease protein